MSKTSSLFVIAGLLLLVGAGCAQQNNQKDNVPATSAVPAVTPTGEIKSFTLVAKKFTFEPETITVNKGDTVRISLTSSDVKHSFSLPEFNVNVELPVGQTKTVEFVADKAGTFSFACRVFCGLGHGGMNGKLIVQ